MPLRWFGARAAGRHSAEIDQVLSESESVRQQLMRTTDKLAKYTESLQVEIERLKTLAGQVGDDGDKR